MIQYDKMPDFILHVTAPGGRMCEVITRTHVIQLTSDEDDVIRLTWHFASCNLDGSYTFTTSTPYAHEYVRLSTRYILTNQDLGVTNWVLMNASYGVVGKCDD